MIFDSIENLGKYACIPHLDSILNFIRNTDISKLPVGDIEIKGKDLFVKVLRYAPKDSSENFFETHSNYTDVQMIYEGLEAMHIVAPIHLTKTDEFKMKGDFTFYKATENISEFVVGKDEFTVFFPGEPHKPGCLYKSIKNPVLKLVFKVRSN